MQFKMFFFLKGSSEREDLQSCFEMNGGPEVEAFF